MNIKQYVLNKNILVFLFCLGVLLGPSTATLLNYELQARCTDCFTYNGVAEFKFDQKNGVRRYRIIVPMLASAIDRIAGDFIDSTKPRYFYGDFSIPVSFFIVNLVFFCLYGVVIYRFCNSFGVGAVAVIIGLLVMLTCRWTSYLAATPMVDSLYCLLTAAVLWALRTNNNRLLVLTVFLGPFAKEAFIFFLPVIFFHARMPKLRLLLYIALSGLVVIVYRYLYEHYSGLPQHSGALADINQINYLKRYWYRWLSPRELYKLVFNINVWILIPLYCALFLNKDFRAICKKIPSYAWWFAGAVFVHMLFGGYDRHFYLAMPVICLAVALCTEAIISRYRELTRPESTIQADAKHHPPN